MKREKKNEYIIMVIDHQKNNIYLKYIFRAKLVNILKHG